MIPRKMTTEDGDPKDGYPKKDDYGNFDLRLTPIKSLARSYAPGQINSYRAHLTGVRAPRSAKASAWPCLPTRLRGRPEERRSPAAES